MRRRSEQQSQQSHQCTSTSFESYTNLRYDKLSALEYCLTLSPRSLRIEVVGTNFVTDTIARHSLNDVPANLCKLFDFSDGTQFTRIVIRNYANHTLFIVDSCASQEKNVQFFGCAKRLSSLWHDIKKQKKKNLLVSNNRFANSVDKYERLNSIYYYMLSVLEFQFVRIRHEIVHSIFDWVIDVYSQSIVFLFEFGVCQRYRIFLFVLIIYYQIHSISCGSGYL